MRTCTAPDCEAKLWDRNATGLCRTHSNARVSAQALARIRHCPCGNKLGRPNHTGFCAQCSLARVNSDPGRKAKISAALKTRIQSNPELLAKMRKQAGDISRSPRATEAKRARCIATRIWERGNAAQPAGSAPRMLAGARGSATKLAWCPAHLRPMYCDLLRSKVARGDARRMVLDHHEREMRQYRARLDAESMSRPVPDLSVYELPNTRFGDDLIATVASLMDVEPHDIIGEGKTRPIVAARVAVAEILHRRDLSYAAIGRRLYRDHTSIIALLGEYEARADKVPAIRRVVEWIEPAVLAA